MGAPNTFEIDDAQLNLLKGLVARAQEQPTPTSDADVAVLAAALVEAPSGLFGELAFDDAVGAAILQLASHAQRRPRRDIDLELAVEALCLDLVARAEAVGAYGRPRLSTLAETTAHLSVGDPPSLSLS
jgi:hypothetical protein